MGLLDDAIREHLELKRLGGADPGDVAREEHDALGPVHRDGETTEGAEEPPMVEAPSTTDRSFFTDTEPTSATDSAPGQETVEINMEAELGAERDPERAAAPPPSERAAPVAHPAHTQGATEESLEWEVPTESSPDSSTEGPGGDVGADDGEEGEQVEDVLEETPDFLRETPEQERLWFEQRPPRDFDFNE
jgi:predicted component of type VI protein secretion system